MSTRTGVSTRVVVVPFASVTFACIRAVDGSNGTAMPICCAGLADGAVEMSGMPNTARTSLAGRIVKLRTIGAVNALPARSLITLGSMVSR